MVYSQEKYNELIKFSKNYIKLHKVKIDSSEYRNIILKKAKELNLTKSDLEKGSYSQKRNVSPEIVKSIMSNPNISEYDKKIYQRDLDGKIPRGCYSHQYKYNLPKGTEGYKRFENWKDCGDHCVCVDKGVDKKSLDKINKNKLININWSCDGEHHAKDPENIEMGQNIPPFKPSLIIKYKGKDKNKLNKVIKSICNTSNVFEQKSGLDVCSTKNLKNSNMFSISGKKRNTKAWWDNIADNLNKL